MEITVLVLDVYGTVLCTNDSDNMLPPRAGFFDFIREIRRSNPNVKIVAASDANLEILKIDLQESGIELSLFDDYFEMAKKGPKDFSVISDKFSVKPSELLVIGDSYARDYFPAISIGANAVCVPEYESANDDFNFLSISLV